MSDFLAETLFSVKVLMSKQTKQSLLDRINSVAIEGTLLEGNLSTRERGIEFEKSLRRHGLRGWFVFLCATGLMAVILAFVFATYIEIS